MEEVSMWREGGAEGGREEGKEGRVLTFLGEDVAEAEFGGAHQVEGQAKDPLLLLLLVETMKGERKRRKAIYESSAFLLSHSLSFICFMSLPPSLPPPLPPSFPRHCAYLKQTPQGGHQRRRPPSLLPSLLGEGRAVNDRGVVGVLEGRA
jgi:hypothetical protein